MDDLNPITRTERLLDGKDLTPTNREEMFIKRIYDKTQEIPEPVNRKEYFLKKAGEASGDVTVVPLSVTDNGTYSEEGKAYSPVTVSVQPPANSYQLKSITTPTSLATFEASEMPMPSLKVSVEAQQDLHGYDKPWVGGAGKNKFDASLLSDVASSIKYVTVTLKANTQYTMSSTIPLQAGSTANLFFMLPSESASSVVNGVSIDRPITVTTGADGQAKVEYRLGDNTESQYASYHYQIEEGSVATSFEPYTNVCPISGWDAANVSDVGKNLLIPYVYSTTISGVTLSYKADGSIEISGTASAAVNRPLQSWATENDVYTRLQAGTYTPSLTGNPSGITLTVLTSDGTSISSGTSFTLTEATDVFMRLSIASGTVIPSGTVINMMIEQGNTATSFEPYINQTTTISLGQTVYGGEVDVVNGTMTVDWVAKDLGELTYNYTNNIFVSQLGIDYKYIIDTPSKCSCYKYVGTIQSGTSDMANKDDSTYALYRNTNYPDVRNIYIKDRRYTDETVFKNAINGQKVLCELAEPIIINLTPSLIKSLNGQNNLSVDCGEVIEGEYFKALGGA